MPDTGPGVIFGSEITPLVSAPVTATSRMFTRHYDRMFVHLQDIQQDIYRAIACDLPIQDLVHFYW